MKTPEKRHPPHKGAGHRQRLRERFLAGGLDGFHDYEVLELLLTLNTPRKDCKESAKLLMKRFKTFQRVLEADVEDLCQVRGIGPMNSLGIRLIREVAQRYMKSRIIHRDVVSNPETLVAYLNQVIGFKATEHFAGIFLDAKNRVLATEVLFSGSLTESSVYPREVIVQALKHQAAGMIFAHNHPSGNITPSQSDLAVTRRLCFALGAVGIVVHEHIITGAEGYYSFAAQGLIEKFTHEFQRAHGGV